MTELEWRVCDDVRRLLRFSEKRRTDRQKFLWWIACCQRAWDSLPDEQRFVVTEMSDYLHGKGSQKPDMNCFGPVVMRVLLQHDVPQGTHADLFRDIIGNPFRPTAVDPSWRTSDVMLLAAGIYDTREFSAMPILADALQDAGCDNDDILAHCRDTSLTHVRGCWVVDLVLGKS